MPLQNPSLLVSMPSFATDPEVALASFFRLGYHIEPNVWISEQCEALIRASENLPSFHDGTFSPAMQPHRLEPMFLNALRNPKIVNIMEQLVSGKVSGIQSEFFFCRPGTRGFALHQDNYYVEAKPDVFASAWSALRDITPEMGGLIIYPGSHYEPILPVKKLIQPCDMAQDPNAHSQQVIMPGGYEPVDLKVPMGATVFLHSHVVHGSHQNCSDQFRYVLLTTYIRCGEPFRPGRYAQRFEIEVS